MMKWIARWFGRAASEAAAVPSVASPPPRDTAAAAAPVQLAAPRAVRGAEIDSLFYRWMTGAVSQSASAGAEKLIIDELTRMAGSTGAGAELVPRVPAVIPQLLRSLRDDSLSGTELARQLAQDVVLVAEVIREANSPYYHPAIPVKSVENAVRLLGQNGLRMVLARVAFRPVISMQAGRCARHVAPHLWVQAEKCAEAARMLAPAMGANTFETYLAALMQNVGLIVAFRLMDQISADGMLPDSDAFCDQLFTQARILSARIGALWDFPATVTGAIAQVHQPNGSTVAAALAQSDRASKLRMLVDAGSFAADDPFILASLTPEIADCFDKLKYGED